MQRLILAAVAACSLAIATTVPAQAADDAKYPLEGVWVAQSLEAGGKPAPAEAVKRMRFTFKGDKLLVKGNFDDDREEECSFKIDPKQSPKQLDFTPPDKEATIAGIYERSGDELKMCLRHAGGAGDRPKEFATQSGSNLVLIVFKKQKP